MYETLLELTCISLILYFIFMEWYRLKASVQGTILNVRPVFPALEREAGYVVTVQLRTGREIEALAEPCAACTYPLNKGDKVDVIRRHHQYIVHVSLIRPTNHYNCECRR